MKSKLKPDLDLESIQYDLIETVCSLYAPGVSVRALAKKFDLSPMKIRKILITGKTYSTDLSTEIDELWRDGKTVGEIAELLNMTTANVNAYLPYERIIYNMEEKSVEADRQQRYRDRKKGLLPAVQEGVELPVVPRARNKTLIVVIGRKLRKVLPSDILDNYTDPLSREIASRGDDQWNPRDPERNIWCAEIVSNGRGKDKKTAVMLESAYCGFAVICPMPVVPDLVPQNELDQMNWDRRGKAEHENREKTKTYRAELEEMMLAAIRSGMLKFCLPEKCVLDYTDMVARIELVKGKPTMPQVRLEELIEQELMFEKGQDPLEHFDVRGNFTSRKYGNSPWYRRVDEAVCEMLQMNDGEQKVWIDRFMESIRNTSL